MATQNPLPELVALEETLEGLMSQTITVERASASDLAEEFVGHYVAPSGEIVACCLSDVDAASILGTAIAAIPPSAVEEFKASGGPPPNVVDNFTELVNIFASLVCSDDSLHARLEEVARAPFSDDVRDFLKGAGRRVDYSIEVSGYGVGRLSFVGA